MDSTATQSANLALAAALARSAGAGLPDWYTAFQRRAADTAATLHLPSRSDERWHYDYAEARRFDALELAASDAHESALRDSALTLAQSESAATALLSGAELTWHGLSAAVESVGGFALPLQDALRLHPGLLEQHFATGALDPLSDKLTAQHFALGISGMVVHLPKGAVVEQQLHILIDDPAEGGYSAPHLLLIAEPRSRAQIVVQHLGGGDKQCVALPMLQAEVGDGADVAVTSVLTHGSRTAALHYEAARLGRDSRYSSLRVNIGGSFVRSDSTLELAGPGADGHLFGVTLATERQRIDHQTHQRHLADHTNSNLLYKNVLLKRARVSYQGIITVDHAAQLTDAYQQNRNLVLSPSARADSSPQLEIEANDVKCSHGSSTSNVDPGMLFYMQARGIPVDLARQLLIGGFISEVLDNIPGEGLRAWVAERIEERLA